MDPRGERKEAAHVDDTSGVEVGFTIFSTRIRGGPKERQAFLGESEHSLKVQRQDLGPSLVLTNPNPKKLNRRQGKLDRDVRTG